MSQFFELDQGEGLYHKYHVERLDDAEGKHKNCPMYVLDLVHDKHAWPALQAYINSCQEEYPYLAADLRRLRQHIVDKGVAGDYE